MRQYEIGKLVIAAKEPARLRGGLPLAQPSGGSLIAKIIEMILQL